MSIAEAYYPPISIFGRIATGRLIIPGYDNVLIAPLAAFIASLSVRYLLILGMPPPLAFAITTFLILLPFLMFGPSLWRWHLVGTHRIVPLARVQAGARRDASAGSEAAKAFQRSLSS